MLFCNVVHIYNKNPFFWPIFSTTINNNNKRKFLSFFPAPSLSLFTHHYSLTFLLKKSGQILQFYRENLEKHLENPFERKRGRGEKIAGVVKCNNYFIGSIFIGNRCAHYCHLQLSEKHMKVVVCRNQNSNGPENSAKVGQKIIIIIKTTTTQQLIDIFSKFSSPPMMVFRQFSFQFSIRNLNFPFAV